MAWVVDTCLLIDVADADPQFAASSADFLDAKRSMGLVPTLAIEIPPP